MMNGSLREEQRIAIPWAEPGEIAAVLARLSARSILPSTRLRTATP
jgi:hypothetical protein